MAYQMIHMEIAYRLLNVLVDITHPAEFILGSVAPDSVHMNPDFEMGRKVKSHLFEGCGEWGDTRDYERWSHNIGEMFAKAWTMKGRTDYRDFVLGMCVHCLTDYWNDLNIWRRLQREYIPLMSPGEFKDAYYPEARGIDIWLYQNSKNTKAIIKLLSEASAFDVEGMVNREDMEKQRWHLLNVQYHVPTVDISRYRFLSADFLENFIESAVNHIADSIKESGIIARQQN